MTAVDEGQAGLSMDVDQQDIDPVSAELRFQPAHGRQVLHASRSIVGVEHQQGGTTVRESLVYVR